ncbi:MAG: tetratricopeptide repeat protein [Litoreibacter sp.]|nr:tetratricopeptide repeat protein [Litoreibacter sp.]
MLRDIYGQTTSLQKLTTLEDWNATLEAFMAHAAVTPEHLARTLAAEPDFALGHAVKGLFYLLLGRRELVETAREGHLAAKSAAQRCPVSDRERGFIDALGAWLGGQPSAAIARLEEVLTANPADTLAMKLSHAIRFVLGDGAGMLRSVEAVMPAYAPDHAGLGYLMGCHAFALEENGDFAHARFVGRQGLALRPDDAWGLHAVAHVYDMTGDAAGGLDWLEGREGAWAHCNNFRYHVWWHKALMHLDLGQHRDVLALYDHEIRQDKTDDYRDISNATSLLSRLELDGVDVGPRWEELAEISANRTEDGCLIFADLHYLLGLIGGGRDAAVKTLMDRIYRDAQRGSNEMDGRMARPGLSAAAGLEAFGDGDYKTAFLNLAHARHSMQRIGGSHAQRDVFERLTIDSGIRAGLLSEAELILRDRMARRGGREDGYCAARFEMIANAQATAARNDHLAAE